MSWDGLYSNEREYPIFKIGDEVYPIKKYRSLTKNNPYIVLDCFIPDTFKHNKDCNIRQIKIMTDNGYTCNYASYYFKKTERQLLIESREYKLDQLI